MSDGIASNVANDSREKHDDAGQPIDVIVATAEAPPSPSPDGGYGWVCVLACFCVNAFTWGVVAVGPLLISCSHIPKENSYQPLLRTYD